ncbi:MAG TPA: hypothetical protein VGG54_22660 [Trebonia sp.]|jgi:hypothetical protein
MAEVNPPAYEQAGTYSADQDRMAYMAMMTPDLSSGPFVPLGGVRPGGSMMVTAQSSPNMSVSVASGTAFVPASIEGNAGWTCHNNGARSVTIAPASAANPRIDLIIAHVYDATDDTGSLSEWQLEAVEGTPASSPAVPPLPTNAILLAEVLVPQAASSITSGDIAEKTSATVALGGVLPATSQTLPGNPYPGMAVYCADTGETVVWQGAIAPSPNTWQAASTGQGPWISRQAAAETFAIGGGWQDYSAGNWEPVFFTAPRSGAVFISVTGGVGNSGGSDVARIGWKLIGPHSGTPVVDYANRNSVASQDGLLIRATVRTLTTGLNPGDAMALYAGKYATTGTPIDDNYGELLVEAVL